MRRRPEHQVTQRQFFNLRQALTIQHQRLVSRVKLDRVHVGGL